MYTHCTYLPTSCIYSNLIIKYSLLFALCTIVHVHLDYNLQRQFDVYIDIACCSYIRKYVEIQKQCSRLNVHGCFYGLLKDKHVLQEFCFTDHMWICWVLYCWDIALKICNCFFSFSLSPHNNFIHMCFNKLWLWRIDLK